MLITSHGLESALALVALIAAVVFFILHLIFAVIHIWWLLAFATIFLALSDLVMRQRRI